MKWKLHFKSVVEIPATPCCPAHQLIGLIHAEEAKTASSWLGIFYTLTLNQICNRVCILSAEFSWWLHSEFSTTKQWIWSQRADPDKCCRRVRNWSTCPKQQSKEWNLASGHCTCKEPKPSIPAAAESWCLQLPKFGRVDLAAPLSQRHFA